MITVTYSPGRYLRTFLDSLPSATTHNIVVIMADNGSTDGAPEAAQCDDVILLPTGGNIGYGAAINAALREVDRLGIGNDFVLIANPDAVFDPNSIDQLLECAARHPRGAAFGPRIREADGSTYPSARALPTLSNGIGHAILGGIWVSNPFSRAYKDDLNMDQEREAGWLSGSCLLLRRSALNEIGGFDERYFMYMEDVDLGDRLRRAGWTSIFCPTSVITHAKGHAAGSRPRLTLKAHHDSAYRYQADRHPQWWQAPLRWTLKLGLQLRSVVALQSELRRRNQDNHEDR
ncbi:glycosyltransferase [Corynebacterium poyangense]|uniref:Glycosyltransferase n=1 Tax=Corynebacterium poyangense TaxID=2684405 RepID=A0A7H0SS49_9CORY|nr:glycosyltransferase [Corynebacterium poyangense]QNQ91374.1 glycosyltransferase [Corynebacterium poyangense]